ALPICAKFFCEALPCEELWCEILALGNSGFGVLSRRLLVRQTLWGKLSFQLRADHIFPRARVPPDMQHIRLAADLAIFHITLFAPGRRVNRGLIPLSTPGTLESTDHANIYRTRSYRWDGVAPGSSRFFSMCRLSSSAYAESVLQRVVRQFLRRVLRQFFAIFPHQ